MNLEYFIAKRISFKSKRTFSKIIVRFAISAIALSTAVMLISLSILKGFQTEIKNKVIGFNSHIQIAEVNNNYTYENKAIRLDTETISKIEKLDGIKSIDPFATKAAIVKTKEDVEGIVLKGVGEQYNWKNISPYIIKGSLPKINDSTLSNEIIISKFLADLLQVDTNNSLELYFVQDPPKVRKFKVSGIYKTGLDEIDKTFALCDIKHIEKLNKWEKGQVGGYEIKVDELQNIEDINDIIRVILPLHIDTKTIFEIFPQLFDWLGILDKNVQIILILMIVVGVVNMITALLIIILEKTNLIGILKSLGSTNTSISRIFIYNAGFMIIAGILIGNIIGLGLLFLQYQFQFIKLPVEYYFIDSVPVLFIWGSFIIINIATFIVCALIMIFPALIVSRIDPLKILRFD